MLERHSFGADTTGGTNVKDCAYCMALGTRRSVIVAAMALLATASGSAEVRLPAILSDGVVLQQHRPIELWGWADAGEVVAARIGERSGRTQTDPDGNWRITLEALPAGGPYELEVTGGASTVRVADVLVGEVWLGSGQSNMAKPVSSAADAEREIATADYPEIRMFTVANAAVPEPGTDVVGQWRAAVPDHVGTLSAVGYYFSRHLHAELGVPVGFVHSSWGGTPAEAWTRRSAFVKPVLAPRLARETEILNSVVDDRALFDETLGRFEAGDEVSPAELVGTWDALITFGQQEIQLAIEIAMDGEALLATFDNFGGEVTVPVDISGASVSWMFPGKLDEQRIRTAYGSRMLSGHMAMSQFEYPVRASQRDSDTQAPRLVGVPVSRRIGHLFNGMIDPLTRFPIRGVVWYQGEANANPEQAPLYADLFATLIEDWRLAWGRPLPFYFVQLANFRERESEPPLESPWAEVRDAQRRTLALPNTAMAVAIDIGEADDIHPKNKQEVGRRLALAALARQYERAAEYSGPLYRRATFAGAEVEIAFDHATGLATADGAEVTGFALAGTDRKFVWANARIEGERVIVWSDAVPAPQSVRYGWGDNPATNLMNQAGLPASPFRTDRW